MRTPAANTKRERAATPENLPSEPPAKRRRLAVKKALQATQADLNRQRGNVEALHTGQAVLDGRLETLEATTHRTASGLAELRRRQQRNLTQLQLLLAALQRAAPAPAPAPHPPSAYDQRPATARSALHPRIPRSPSMLTSGQSLALQQTRLRAAMLQPSPQATAPREPEPEPAASRAAHVVVVQGVDRGTQARAEPAQVVPNLSPGAPRTAARHR